MEPVEDAPANGEVESVKEHNEIDGWIEMILDKEEMIEAIGKCSISRQEEELRWAFAYGKMTFDQYMAKRKKLLAEGKITMNGKVVENG